ncbi:hypothetical protein D3C81_2099840 [compost metagenome]
MLMTLRRDLWQMGYGQYLSSLAQPTQQLADDFGGRAANAHVDFVEHQRWHA